MSILLDYLKRIVSALSWRRPPIEEPAVLLQKDWWMDTVDPEEFQPDPDKIVIGLEDGTVLTASMLLDKDGNETETLFDAVTLLAKHEGNGAWYEIDIKAGSWEKPSNH